VIRKSDLHIIRYLQDNPRATVPTISRATGISEATVRRRVDALFNSGVIASAIIPNVDRLGYRSMAYVALKVDLTRMNEIVETIRSFPEVTTIAEILGPHDLMFFIAQPTNEDLRRFVTEHIATIPGVRQSETWVVPRLPKLLSEWRVPIDNETVGENGRLEERALDRADEASGQDGLEVLEGTPRKGGETMT
jgi:Lrp/AsnC family transcriptional regulator, regulator for asnA, asnC and gidA